MANPIRALTDQVLALPDSYKDLHMEELMAPTLKALPILLFEDPHKSLYITYETPYLMRIAYMIGNADKKIIINGHYFFGENCTDLGFVPDTSIKNPYFNRVVKPGTPDNLFHAHPWAATFKLFSGAYDQKIGIAARLGLDCPPDSFEIVRQDANDPETNTYTFNDPKIWHEVLPINNEPVSTLMISYIPKDWLQKGPTPAEDAPLRHLSDTETRWMKQHFLNFLSP